MGRIAVWVPEIPPLSPEAQRRSDMMLEWHLANPDLVQAYLEQFELTESMRKYREAVLLTNNEEEIKPRPSSTIAFIPSTAIDTSAPTCATKGEDTMYKLLLAKADPRSSRVIKIINPATGIADDVFKAAMMKRYRQEPKEPVHGVPHEELPGASVLKLFREELGVSSETVTTDSSTSTTGISDKVLGAAVLKRPRKDLSESTGTVDTPSGIAHEVLPGASILKRFCKEAGESSENVAEDSPAPTTSSGSASCDN